MATTTSSRCDACGANAGPWQITISSECAHTFQLRFVPGSAACPSCATTAKDNASATDAAPAPAPATPFSFPSTSPFGRSSTANSSSGFTTTSGAFGQLPQATASPSSSPFGCSSTPSPFSTNFSGAQPTASSLSSTSFSGGQPSETSLFGKPLFGKQQASCSACGSAMGGGEATVTSECAHTFHLRCFSGVVCPACSARWRYEATVKPSPSSTSPVFSISSASPQPSSAASQSAGFIFAPPSSSSSPQQLSSAPPMPSWFSRAAGSTFAPAATSPFSSYSPFTSS